MLRRRTPAILGSDRRPFPGSIAALEPVPIGGTRQWVLLRGVDPQQPVLLVIPDGPGETLLPLARRVQGELERAFVVANWDPRGSGLSQDRDVLDSSLTLERLVEDAVELARWLARRCGTDRVVLAGHGFGSVVGILAAQRAPECFTAYIGVGQWVEPLESERRSLAWAREEAERRNRRDLLGSLGTLGAPGRSDPGPPPVLRAAVRSLGGEFVNPDGRSNARPSIAGAQEYTVLDLWYRRPRGIARSRRTVGQEVRGIDLATRVTRLGVPTFFIAGRHDHVVDPELAREYLRVLEAPRKGWAWIEETAHLAPFEDPDAYAAALAHYAHDARGPAAPSWSVAG
ncbi:MAG TPA: alpha/beta hydrolase [Thermoplasmata archaeon]|nr:alpha/beta hydrolase [Thermoplasmata archaeon]